MSLKRGIYPTGFNFHTLLSYPNAQPLLHVERPIEIITNGLLLANIAADAPDGRPGKRKASNTIRAHWGLPSDSSDRLSLIALSRLLRTQDMITINQVFSSPLGPAILSSLQSIVLRVATTVGGANLSLTNVNVSSLLNLSGSSFISRKRYEETSLSLPGKLPHPNAKALVKAMLDALAASVITPDGSRLMRQLIAIPLPLLDEQMQATIAAVMTSVESEMRSRLTDSGGAGASSSSSSSLLPMPNPPAQPAPTQLDVSVSMNTNAIRLVQSRLGRALTQAETETLDTGLVEAFSLLTTGNQAQRRATLQLVALTTLSTAAGAQLWASMLEVVTTDGGGSFSVDGFVNALSNAVSAIAGAQLAASSFGV